MAAIDSAYQYCLSTYGNSLTSRYDSHKKSQLRAVCNNIVKTNKDAPLYKVHYSGDVQKFAIDIKEKTRSIQNMVASLSDTASEIEDVFSKKIAQSSDEETVSAEYIGSGSDEPAPFEVEVLQLAAPQINLGRYLDGNASDIKPGTYRFHLNTTLNSYEFQYSVNTGNTNRDVQEKIARLINSAKVGLHAELVYDASGKSALQITSQQTGLSESEQYLFEIMPSPDSLSIKAMRKLGIDNVEKTAQNSSFLLNGAERSSLSNTFTVNNAFALTLKRESHDGSTAQIGFKANSDAIADNVQSLVGVYNNIIQLGHDYADKQHSNKLLRDMSDVAKAYYNELESIGLKQNPDGYISIDHNLLADAVTANDIKESFTILNKFKDSLNEKASAASIDPMRYVDKVIVSYKNPGHNFAAPYVISMYSGMMLDCYC